MQTDSSYRLAVFCLAFVGLVGCGASQAKPAEPVTTTGAEVSSSSLPEGLPTTREALPEAKADHAEPKREELPGQLVCRTKNRDIGEQELRLEWEGNEAKGTIRTIAPSGETTVQRVTAEKYRGLIVVDDPNNVDLALHAAIVGSANGKQAMRVGSGMFATCE